MSSRAITHHSGVGVEDDSEVMKEETNWHLPCLSAIATKETITVYSSLSSLILVVGRDKDGDVA